MKIHFYLRYSTKYGEGLSLSINSNGQETRAALSYLNEEFWQIILETEEQKFQYQYILVNDKGEEVHEWGNDRIIDAAQLKTAELFVIDTWNHAGEYENVFYTKPFADTLLTENKVLVKPKPVKNFSHLFRVKAPLLKKDEVVCLLGSGDVLGNWQTENPVLLSPGGNWWNCKLNFSKESFPVAYKYGVYDQVKKVFVRYEEGDNRILHDNGGMKKITLLHDGFVHLPNNTWKGAGIAVPVFSLRSENSFGVGEFTDIRLLVDWAKKAALKLIQLLPVNDTTANHSWTDSYPYAPISVYALHPLYLNVEKAAGKKYSALVKPLKEKQKQLNEMPQLDYEAVMKYKLGVIEELYYASKDEIFESGAYKNFFTAHQHWLVPYAAYCYLRDKYQTPDFSQWKTNSRYDETAIRKLTAPSQKHFDKIGLIYFTQYQLHLQLHDAAGYAHRNGIILKGDLPIGIYRNSVDAWQQPGLFNMNEQSGAPPDDFAVKGQNWGFPTYNWKKMQEDGFGWWKKRFEHTSHYFDAFRVDHILGFFRIWSIPMDALEGIMGRFVPALPIHINELNRNGSGFDYHRYCNPYITDVVLSEIFGYYDEKVKTGFLVRYDDGTYALKQEFNTQRKVEAYFDKLDGSEENNTLRYGLYDLVSNVILFEEPGSNGEQFHFRISMEKTLSFRYLGANVQQRLKELYLDYFFRRQDDFWMKEAMHKLPSLKNATNMLVCGEDLGMVPHCVPEVMQQLGILSLEIQRMPKDTKKEFFHPNDAPYMSVVTPSTHDMSTIRGWWEEDRSRTQRFYNNELGQFGDAPYYCDAWIAKSIILQHLYSPAMWSIFQLQDLFACNENLRIENPPDERINVPSNPKHYWRYRIPVTIEEMMKREDFNKDLMSYIKASGR